MAHVRINKEAKLLGNLLIYLKNNRFSYILFFLKIMANAGPFSSSTAFCVRCGSILPLLQEFGSVKCYTCKSSFDAESKKFFFLYLSYRKDLFLNMIYHSLTNHISGTIKLLLNLILNLTPKF